MLRAGLIGCGRIATDVADDPKVGGVYSHAEAYVRSERTTLVGVADIDPERAARCARRWDLPPSAAYTDVATLLDEARPDVVSICTPDGTHAAVLDVVLSAPGVRGVLVEKPIAMSADAATELTDRAAAAGIALAVNYHRRHALSLRALAEELRGGGFGAVQVAHCLYTGGLLHNGSHVIDTLRLLVGEITVVEGWDVLSEAGPDPTLDARLGFQSGARAVLSGGTSPPTVFEIDLLLTRGRVRLADHGNTIETFVEGDLPFYSGYTGLVHDGRRWPTLGDVAIHAVDDLADAVELGTEPRCGAADGIRALRVAEAVRNAAALGRAQSVP